MRSTAIRAVAAGLFGLASLYAAAAVAQPAKGVVDDARLLAANDAADANWITFGQDLSNQRFSSLTGVTRANVARLARHQRVLASGERVGEDEGHGYSSSARKRAITE